MSTSPVEITSETVETADDKAAPRTRTIRVDITAETVKEAAAKAAEHVRQTAERTRGDGKKKPPLQVTIWADRRQHYLLIRQRGGAADWIVKTRGRTRVLGDIRERHDGFLSVRAARDKAATLYGAIANGYDPQMQPPEPAPEPSPVPKGWTWDELAKRFQATLKEVRVTKTGRIKHPRRGTQDDVRLAFARPSIAALGPTRLPDLKPIDLIVANRAIESHRMRCKALAYVQSALNWALSQYPDEAGLLDIRHPWWMDIEPAAMSGEEAQAQQARKQILAQRKAELNVDHLGEILVRHEEYCAGRTAEEKVSPGVRFGFWWLMFTGNRRFSVTALERERLMQADEFGRDGWGRAMWPEWMIKGGAEFWLPLPEEVLAVANYSMEDHTVLVRRWSQSRDLRTRWVFASTRRLPRERDDDPVEVITAVPSPDVAVYPNSLNQHLRAMRGEKKRLDGSYPENVLKGLPYYSPHLTRTVITNTLVDRNSTVPKGGISAMLAHAGDKADDSLARTTREFYHTNQRMAEKADAMSAWRDALLSAYTKAGGKPPKPSES